MEKSATKTQLKLKIAFFDRIAVFRGLLCGRGRLLADTAHANRLKEHDSRPTRPSAAIASSHTAATEECDTVDSGRKTLKLRFSGTFFHGDTVFGSVTVSSNLRMLAYANLM